MSAKRNSRRQIIRLYEKSKIKSNKKFVISKDIPKRVKPPLETHVELDYDKFTLDPDNRDPVKHALNLEKAIHKHNYTRLFPIIIDKYGNILDGQGRFIACYLLNLPIYYVIWEKGMDMRTIAWINGNVHPWVTMTYINVGYKTGHEGYAMVKDCIDLFKTEFKSGVDLAARLFNVGKSSSFKSVDLVDTFPEKFDHNEMMEEAHLWIDTILSFGALPKNTRLASVGDAFNLIKNDDPNSYPHLLISVKMNQKPLEAESSDKVHILDRLYSIAGIPIPNPLKPMITEERKRIRRTKNFMNIRSIISI